MKQRKEERKAGLEEIKEEGTKGWEWMEGTKGWEWIEMGFQKGEQNRQRTEQTRKKYMRRLKFYEKTGLSLPKKKSTL